MTRTEADLASIMTQGVIEARAAYGIAKKQQARGGGQRSVCFTEMPLAELSRMARRGREFGIVFSKEYLRSRRGAQPVWYLTDPSPQLDALRDLMRSSTTQNDPIWRLTPFIDQVRDAAKGPNDWRWEREWRISEDFLFDVESIAAVLIPTPGGEFEPLSEVSFGALYITPDGGAFWADGFVDATNAAMELLIGQFHDAWISLDEACLPRDGESRYGYFETVEIVDADEAVYEQFEQLPVKVQDALTEALRLESELWCRVGDMENLWEPDFPWYVGALGILSCLRLNHSHHSMCRRRPTLGS